jgi:hypothetical protein
MKMREDVSFRNTKYKVKIITILIYGDVYRYFLGGFNNAETVVEDEWLLWSAIDVPLDAESLDALILIIKKS